MKEGKNTQKKGKRKKVGWQAGGTGEGTQFVPFNKYNTGFI